MNTMEEPPLEKMQAEIAVLREMTLMLATGRILDSSNPEERVDAVEVYLQDARALQDENHSEGVRTLVGHAIGEYVAELRASVQEHLESPSEESPPDTD